ncbi:LOW QUALITY PROTEIN: hypothetical protein U9M48_015595 [Paspalum notatum var. saurae]|uniref:Uncharacterized protein n=1 Tax=Paspalum notatum var. saurae TaxID=547442 RepID=A0AAQ3T5K6_PASNO
MMMNSIVSGSGSGSGVNLPGSLRSGRELGGVDPGVVGDGVVEVVEQVLEGPLAGDDGLDEESEHGEHGEASVLDLLDLELGEGDGVVGEAERVEVLAPRVEVVALADAVEAVDAESLDEAHEDDLESQHGEDALRVHQVGVAQSRPPSEKICAPALNHTGSLKSTRTHFSSTSGVMQPSAPSMAHRPWITSSALLRANASGSADSPAVSQP